jgi:hypothetical protein
MFSEEYIKLPQKTWRVVILALQKTNSENLIFFLESLDVKKSLFYSTVFRRWKRLIL